MTEDELIELNQRQADADLRAMLSTPDGRRFIWSFIERTDPLSPTFAGEETHHTAHREGRRSVGLGLMTDCQEASRADYVLMLSEAFARTEKDRVLMAAAQERNDGR